MKKEYIRPVAEFIDFQSKDAIMVDIGGDGPSVGGSVDSRVWEDEE